MPKEHAKASGCPPSSCHQVKEGQKRHIRLCLVDRLQQLLKDRTDSWGVFWAMRGIKGKRRDAGADLLQVQQSTLEHFGGERRGGERGHRSCGDCSQCSHKHPTRECLRQVEAQWLRSYLSEDAVQCSQRLLDAT